MDAAALAGIKRVIIPSCQRFDTDCTGQVVNIVRHASDLNLECVPVDDLVDATETAMNDPLPPTTLDSGLPKYSNDVANYIDGYAQREQSETASGLKFAPKETELGNYAPRQAAIWKSVYADFEAGQEAYRAGQVYVAYQLFTRANGRMNGANALAGQTRATFDVKQALADADALHTQLHTLMNPPSIDQGGLQSSLLVAEMADWAFSINAALEGAQLLTKQTFSQRSDATETEKDRAREAIIFANAQCKYLLTQGDFYTGLLDHLAKENPTPVDQNASHLLPQLFPAQLATARAFTDGIRASDLRDGLLFDPRLVAYENGLREVKAEADSHEPQRENQAAPTPPAPASTDTNSDGAPVKPDASGAAGSEVGFDPGTTYLPPHTAVVATTTVKKISDPALCLIWVNHDCEIATLAEKYLRLSGTMDPGTHEWHVKDRAKLDAMLQTAEVGARRGIAFAEKAELDPSVLAMIYERAAHQRVQTDDNAALDALRNYWRCALLGNMCWQLAHTHKAQPVDLGPVAGGDKSKKNDASTKTDGGSKTDKTASTSNSPGTSTNTSVTVVPPSAPPADMHDVVVPTTVPDSTNAATVVNPAPTPPEPEASGPSTVTAHDDTAPAPPPTPAPAPAPAHEVHSGMTDNPPVAPIATNFDSTPAGPVVPAPAPVPTPVAVDPPVAPIATHSDVAPVAPVAVTPATNAAPTPAPPAPAPAPSDAEANIPVAPIARAQDYEGNPATNSAPVIPPAPTSTKTSDNADSHSF